MTPKEKRDRLFKGGRPLFRPLNILDGDSYHTDVAINWLAHSIEPFYHIMSTDQDGFAMELSDNSIHLEYLISEDENSYYESGAGPIGMVWIPTDGWRVEPHCVFYPWATARNKLRSTVSFFQMVRYRKIGTCLVRSLESSKALFDKASTYGVLHYVGKVPNGDPRGDEYLYSVRGKRQ